MPNWPLSISKRKPGPRFEACSVPQRKPQDDTPTAAPLLPHVQKFGFIHLASWQVIRILKWLENSDIRDRSFDTEAVGTATIPFTQQVSVAEIAVFISQQEAKEVSSLIRVERMKSRQDGNTKQASVVLKYHY
jgi:hypothetical protein